MRVRILLRAYEHGYAEANCDRSLVSKSESPVNVLCDLLTPGQLPSWNICSGLAWKCLQKGDNFCCNPFLLTQAQTCMCTRLIICNYVCPPFSINKVTAEELAALASAGLAALLWRLSASALANDNNSSH